MVGFGTCSLQRRTAMSEWIENSNGNYVYVIGSDDFMTVYQRNGEWLGVYESRFIEDGFKKPEQAMALMEKAVLGDRLDLLVKRKPMPTGWRETKNGGYHCVRRDRTMTVRQAKSGKWYLVINQTMVQGKWFDTANEAKRQGDQL
jgi:ferredoxin-NADP reductase